jgi:hypothetical protein
VLAYLLWAVSVAAAIAILLLTRTSIIIALGVTPWDRYVEHALNQFGFLFLAIFSLAVVVFIEHYYRTAVEQGKLFLRFFLVSFWEVLWLALIQLAALLSAVMLDLFTPTMTQIVGSAILLCAILYWAYRRASQAYVAPEI